MFVTASAAQGLEQAASGARVIGPLGSGAAAAAVRDEIEAARAARPLSVAEVRVLLRDIFLTQATPARLAALVKAAGLPASLVGGRRVAVLAAVADGAQAGRLAAALLAQRLRPAEVIAGCPATDTGEAAGRVRDTLGVLSGHGIRVVVTEAGRAGPAGRGADWARPLARLASAAWLAPWAGRRRAAGGLPARPGLRAGVRAGGRGWPDFGSKWRRGVRVHPVAG